ncbi:MAG TPA: immunoglobulin-like domain-containing protein [Flavisolibacter sp.]|nr:immunoglobulin-like domain-containing protein [Flavisolibacter sp.]
MRIVATVFSFILIAGLISCNKDDNDFNYPEGTVGHSKIVYFPAVAIKGEHLIILKQGDSYTEPGVTATLNGQTAQFTTTGTVNTAVPGVYNLTYESKNPEGYAASDWRTVVVIGNDVAANDFSGTYLRAATGVTSTWTKIAPGVYEVDNPGGAGVGVGYKVIAVNYTGNKIRVPKQFAMDPSSGSTGIVSTTSETYNATATPPSYSWIFLAGGYGTGLRTFTKQ